LTGNLDPTKQDDLSNYEEINSDLLVNEIKEEVLEEKDLVVK